ncbi:unnamed protein product [Mytilus coruscus]|uniref:Transposase Tc1-like domain-containing protein n=1 Tax=Mytilus coruscus TaxID=42192 RepID=A0A6J8A793_MYTCO|nr:unnamed protein product [Mytilus coruscus]
MVRRRISEAQRWQIIGMRSSGLSYKAIGRQMGYHYTVVSRLVRKHIQTNNVKDLPRSGRPLVTSQCEDRALQRLIRQIPFVTSPVLKREWLPYRQLSTRTLRNRLKSAGLKSRRVIRRPMLTDRHQQLRLAWCLACSGRRVQAAEPPVQNLRQLEAALHREWRQIPQQKIRRLTGGMRRRVEACIQSRGGFTRY